MDAAGVVEEDQKEEQPRSVSRHPTADAAAESVTISVATPSQRPHGELQATAADRSGSNERSLEHRRLRSLPARRLGEEVGADAGLPSTDTAPSSPRSKTPRHQQQQLIPGLQLTEALLQPGRQRRPLTPSPATTGASLETDGGALASSSMSSAGAGSNNADEATSMPAAPSAYVATTMTETPHRVAAPLPPPLPAAATPPISSRSSAPPPFVRTVGQPDSRDAAEGSAPAASPAVAAASGGLLPPDPTLLSSGATTDLLPGGGAHSRLASALETSDVIRSLLSLPRAHGPPPSGLPPRVQGGHAGGRTSGSTAAAASLRAHLARRLRHPLSGLSFASSAEGGLPSTRRGRRSVLFHPSPSVDDAVATSDEETERDSARSSEST
jgi:hypothetical protein